VQSGVPSVAASGLRVEVGVAIIVVRYSKVRRRRGLAHQQYLVGVRVTLDPPDLGSGLRTYDQRYPPRVEALQFCICLGVEV
jgi:hypothetical protein